MTLIESGLIQGIKDKYVSQDRLCKKKLSSIVHQKTGVHQIFGVFLALGIGLSIATITFVMEMVFVRCKIITFNLKNIVRFHALITNRQK